MALEYTPARETLNIFLESFMKDQEQNGKGVKDGIHGFQFHKVNVSYDCGSYSLLDN